MCMLWYVCTAPLWAAPLASWINQDPTQTLECTVTEVFADGGKTPTGSFTIVVRKGDQTGVPKGWTRLEGTWHGDPTLSVSIKAFDKDGGKFPLEVDLENYIKVPDKGDGVTGQVSGVGFGAESRDIFVVPLSKADGFGGHYEFEFHKRSTRWYQVWLP